MYYLPLWFLIEHIIILKPYYANCDDLLARLSTRVISLTSNDDLKCLTKTDINEISHLLTTMQFDISAFRKFVKKILNPGKSG